ncbi:MAG: hypothetical protein NTW69_21070, partial [Chloroflexi bacterium]|nr:hypothetical protein [Chloroflexota bacterium]
QTTSNNAGNVSAASNIVTVQIDKALPTITAAATTSPNAAGWYKNDVSIHFTCADTGGSGIASCPGDQLLSATGSSAALTAIDNAGNVSAGSNVVAVQIDKTVPTIVAAATTPPNVAGWYNGNVTVHFTCTAGTSGIVSCPADQLLTASGSSTAQTTSNNAGNVSAASNIVTVQIDKALPCHRPFHLYCWHIRHCVLPGRSTSDSLGFIHGTNNFRHCWKRKCCE